MTPRADTGREPDVFDVTAPLGPRTLIEASAGTGKTYALCGLVAYLIGSGTAQAQDLLVVTFTNLATRDLKSRIRERLIEVRDLLTQSESSWDDAVAAALRANAAAPGHLNDALADLDDLAVSTIHGFAQRTLTTFGTSIGVDPEATLVADDKRFTNDLIADELASLATLVAASPATDATTRWLPDVDSITSVVDLLTNIPDLQIEPTSDAPSFIALVEEQQRRLEAATSAGEDEDPLAEQLAQTRVSWIVRDIVRKAQQRRRGSNIRNYGDLLLDLREALDGPDGAAVRWEMQQRHRFVLIDEFQDTDRVQWDIFDRCFGTGEEGDPSHLVLVGDPKQAIYRFRGADIHVYGHVATQLADATYPQRINHRSDSALLEELDFLFDGASFGAQADFIRVGASPRNMRKRIRWRDSTVFEPVRIHVDPHGRTKHCARQNQIDDCADWIRRLRHDAELEVELTEGTRAWRPVGFGDIAVLTRDKHLARDLDHALRRRGVPAVVVADDDVREDPSLKTFGSDPAPSRALWEWQLLLDAIGDPTDARCARAASVGLFGPETTERDVAAVLADDARTASFQADLARWAGILTRKGTGPLIATLRAETSWVRRALLADDTGRLSTDLEHVAELLVDAGGVGPTSTDRLIEAIDVSEVSESAKETLSRRLPTDAPAVTIMTLHKAKGLEFPIVGCIGLDRIKEPNVARFHRAGIDPTDPGVEVLDLTAAPPALDAAAAEEIAEELRLLYVGFTRARHHLFTYWTAPDKPQRLDPIGRLLFSRERSDTGSRIVAEDFLAGVVGRVHQADDTPEDGSGESGSDADLIQAILDDPGERFLTILDSSPASTTPPTTDRTRPDGPDGPTARRAKADDLHVARFGRTLDRRNRWWSYTSIARASQAEGHDDFQDDAHGGDDEGAATDDTGSPLESTTDQPLAGLPRGTQFGTLVHEILERVDFAAPDLDETIRHEMARVLDGSPLGLSEAQNEQLVSGLVQAIRAPLGTEGSVRTLADLTRADRLSECRFDLRLDTDPAARDGLHRIAEILTDPVDGLNTDDPYRPWAEQLLARQTSVDVAGQLNGSLDLVFRTTLDDGTVRFHVTDYKTNVRDRYDPAALVAAMSVHDYPLQALLYSVALHRYLRWRVPGYDPQVHLGDVRYLFLRGMTGQTVGEPPGVASWLIPTSVVEQIDALFGEAAAR